MPLKGIKVIELAGLAPAPFCGMILADFGASVIRVDKTDSFESYPDSLANGKRSIALNLKHETGKQIMKKLCNRSDVVIEPFRRGVMEKLNLGPKDLMEKNETLIYARLTGFGQNGSYADRAGHDINFLSLTGLLSLFGRANSKPVPPVNFAADFAGGGLTCALGIILALFERSKSGKGQVIDASMVDGAAYVGSWLYRSQNIPLLWNNPRGHNILDTGSHFYDTYETKDDKYMAVGALEPNFYAIFIEKLGLDIGEISQFENFEQNRLEISEKFKTKTQAEWCSIFNEADACVTPVLDIHQAPKHKHNIERKTFKTISEDLYAPNPAPCLSRTPGVSKANKPNPHIGEHTIEILNELNYAASDIDNLILSGVVQQGQKQSKL